MKTPGRILGKGFLMLLAVLIGLAGADAAPAPFKEIIAFGDSLTDVGNVALVTETGYAPVIEGYYKETHFSDNILWVEILADYWGLPARTPGRGFGNKLSPKIRGNTWAWGGSEAGSGTVQPTGVTAPIPNLLKEIDQYLTYNIPTKKTLYTIWSGADNLLVGGKFGPQAATQAVNVVVKGMQRLERAGARQFLVFNLPKMGLTPDAQSGGKAAIAAANLYSDTFNAALDVALEKLRNDRSFKGKIYFVNTYSLLVSVYDTVSGGGTYTPDFFVPGNPVTIDNVSDIGLDYFDDHGTYPTDYLFWDVVHPTTQGHQLVAGLVLQAVQGSSTEE